MLSITNNRPCLVSDSSILFNWCQWGMGSGRSGCLSGASSIPESAKTGGRTTPSARSASGTRSRAGTSGQGVGTTSMPASGTEKWNKFARSLVLLM